MATDWQRHTHQAPFASVQGVPPCRPGHGCRCRASSTAERDEEAPAPSGRRPGSPRAVGQRRPQVVEAHALVEDGLGRRLPGSQSVPATERLPADSGEHERIRGRRRDARAHERTPALPHDGDSRAGNRDGHHAPGRLRATNAPAGVEFARDRPGSRLKVDVGELNPHCLRDARPRLGGERDEWSDVSLTSKRVASHPSSVSARDRVVVPVVAGSSPVRHPSL